MAAYYNEIDAHAAAWLRNLVAAGCIAPGDVDERDIRDVHPDDLRGYEQCHFFAGIGVWSHALRRAGWPDDGSIWTGSCPCQPFSKAGARGGFADERHLWPHWHHLIRECRPRLVLGEQVASRDGLGWLDLVCADLEGEGYAVGALDLCAAGFGAPHIRQRLYFGAYDVRPAAGLADSGCKPVRGRRGEGDVASCQAQGAPRERQRGGADAATGGKVRGMADADGGQPGDGDLQPGGQHGLLAQGDGDLREAGRGIGHNGGPGLGGPRPTDGFWRDADWLWCRDGRWRPVEPGLEPLVDGAAARVVRLRAYGNAIVAPQAEAFCRAFLASVA